MYSGNPLHIAILLLGHEHPANRGLGHPQLARNRPHWQALRRQLADTRVPLVGAHGPSLSANPRRAVSRAVPRVPLVGGTAICAGQTTLFAGEGHAPTRKPLQVRRGVRPDVLSRCSSPPSTLSAWNFSLRPTKAERLYARANARITLTYGWALGQSRTQWKGMIQWRF